MAKSAGWGLCPQMVRKEPHRARTKCGGAVLYLVGTAKVKMCAQCAARFPDYVLKEDVLQTLLQELGQ